MKRLYKICVLCAFLGVANAGEGNGVFGGFEVGFAEQQVTLSNTTNATSNVTGNANGANSASTTSNTAMVFGIKLGYKHFFNEWIGIRGYASLDYAQSLYHIKSGKSWRTGVLGNGSYVANIDALLNFYNTENANFGAFAGLGIGGQTTFDSFYLYTDETRTITDLYVDLKLGVRVNVANHGMELIAKIPLNTAKKTFDEGVISVDAKYRQLYQILLGYNYSF
ncbi:outer membrane beta-barrel protein [Helicobacter sp. 23-1044]